jgi:hypothetical protein
MIRFHFSKEVEYRVTIEPSEYSLCRKQAKKGPPAYRLKILFLELVSGENLIKIHLSPPQHPSVLFRKEFTTSKLYYLLYKAVDMFPARSFISFFLSSNEQLQNK